MNPDPRSDNLTDEEILYLVQRNLLTPTRRAELGVTDDDVRKLLRGEPLNRFQGVGEVDLHKTPTIKREGLERVLVPDPDEGDVDDTPYDERSNSRLRAELVDRNEARGEMGLEQLQIGGRKDELVAALRQDDEERNLQSPDAIDAGDDGGGSEE